MDLNFTIQNQNLRRTDSQEIVNKSRNYLRCNFTFESTDWNDIEKFVLFKNSKGNNYVVGLGTAMYGSAIVPSDVLLGEYFFVSVYGGDLITTNMRKVILTKSGYSTNITSTHNFTKDIFVQITEFLEDKVEDISFDGNKLIISKKQFNKEELVTDEVDLGLSNIAHTGSYEDIIDFNEGFDNRMNLWIQDLIDGINEL